MAELRLEEFSGGYYKAEMVAQPYGDGPSIEKSFYDFLNQRFYQNADTEPIFKFGLNEGSHFKPSADPSLPPDVLAIPQEWFDDEPIDDDSKMHSIFIVKPEQSYYLQSVFDGELTSGE